MNRMIVRIWKRAISVGRMLLLYCLAVCFAGLLSGCSLDLVPNTELQLFYHTGDSAQLVPLESVKQTTEESRNNVYHCTNPDPDIFSETGVMYLQVLGNKYGEITVKCDDKVIASEDGFYPIDVEKNAKVVITNEYNFLHLYQTTTTYSFQFQMSSAAKITDISYRLDNGLKVTDYTVFDFDSDTTEYVVEKKIPYDTLELVLNCVPKDEEFELTYSPSRRILIKSEKGEEVALPVTVTVKDPNGKYTENTYTIKFIVEENPVRDLRIKHTPSPSPTPEDGLEPIQTETPAPTAVPTPEVTATPVPQPTVKPTVTAIPLPNPTTPGWVTVPATPTPPPSPTLTPTPTPTPTPSPTPTPFSGEKTVIVPNMIGMHVGKTGGEVAKSIFEQYPELEEMRIQIEFVPSMSNGGSGIVPSTLKGVVTTVVPSPGSILQTGSYVTISVK